MEASFEERAELVAALGIKVIPLANLFSRKIVCRLNLLQNDSAIKEKAFARVNDGGPKCTIDRTFSLNFSLVT